MERGFPALPPLQKSIPPLVVIAGHWRSGTTLLHELLSESAAFAFPNTFSCLNPHTFILGRGAMRGKPAEMARPMDGMTIRDDLPQEDEFALYSLGAPSPYEALLFPSAVRELAVRSDPAFYSLRELEAWKNAFARFCAAHQTGGRPLLLKSPPHSLKAELILALRPDTKFIRIIRDPRSLFESNRILWRSLWATYSLTPWVSNGDLDAAILESLVHFNRIMQRDFGFSTNAITIRYEDLVADTQNVLRSVLDFLAVPPASLDLMAGRVKAMGTYSKRKNNLTSSEIDMVQGACADAMEQYGYTFN
jgi:hypothetical protein